MWPECLAKKHESFTLATCKVDTKIQEIDFLEKILDLKVTCQNLNRGSGKNYQRTKIFSLDYLIKAHFGSLLGKFYSVQQSSLTRWRWNFLIGTDYREKIFLDKRSCLASTMRTIFLNYYFYSGERRARDTCQEQLAGESTVLPFRHVQQQSKTVEKWWFCNSQRTF